MYQIEKEETERLGWNPLWLEKQFLRYVVPYGEFKLEQNNKKNPYDIDYKVVDQKGTIVAWIDMEFRSNKLSLFPTIHIPVFNFTDFYKQKFVNNSPKVIFYKQNPIQSFHLAWSLKEKIGFLIQGKDILSSKVITVKDRQRQKGLFCYDVPKEKAILVNRHNLIKKVIMLINQQK